MSILTTRDAAKTALRDALQQYDGDVKHEVVKAKIEQLCELNPTVAPTHSDRLESAEWMLISAPSFPQGEKLPNGQYAYTLGRLAFNLFKPTNLKVVIDCVKQPILKLEEVNKFSHDIVVEFTVIDSDFPKLKGLIYNLGICYPDTDNTVQVEFTGGKLSPQPNQDLNLWKQVFNQEKSDNKGLKEAFTSFILKIIFGLVPPNAMNNQTGEITFEMKRSPKGKSSILYLDEEIRINKGDKGTVVVLQRSL
ncbi:unknown [Crocosphaera subtropica ATCC 51142]|uniref:Plastid lipid-associated protein/fibrillin conserved domain-containing protein n=1 Tax=Crocosphaera subtropica (strain ATCC 51142 / BH68) TaxID=43989 RepID=B1X0M5_CROS5|nr:PAP/fibrillin family protein [Crocosphaera subtropica]ACB51314.1 unknown [Crocosphaera subtropica ATCC 51142]